MRLALVLTGGFFVVVVVVAVLATRSGGNDAQTASNVTTPAEKRPVKVVITDTERAQEEETDGGIAGLSIFKASGAITDRGTVTTYRGLTGANDSVILLRFVTKGKEGGITYMVKIDTTRRPVVRAGGSSLRPARIRGYRAGARSPKTPTTPSAR